MYIEDKYLGILNLLIYDKRTKMNGIICSFQISEYISGYGISYKAYMNRQYSDVTIYVEDFEKGNVVFLLPYSIKYLEKELEAMSKQHEKKIKEFFGDDFREDMIMRISEEDRQEQIRKWDMLTIGLENWNNKYET